MGKDTRPYRTSEGMGGFNIVKRESVEHSNLILGGIIVIYDPHQKVYFQLETVESILDENETEICDMDMMEQLDEAKRLILEIAQEAYRRASKS